MMGMFRIAVETSDSIMGLNLRLSSSITKLKVTRLKLTVLRNLATLIFFSF